MYPEYSLEDVADSGDGGRGDDPLGLFEAVLLVVAVALGVLASIGLTGWALAHLGQLAGGSVMIITPIQLLALIGRVAQRALADWRAMHSKPLVVRVIRAFFIGFAWPLWIFRFRS